MAVIMEPFFFFFFLINNNIVFFFVLITTSLAVNLQFEKNDILTGPEDKKPEFTDVVTNQTVVEGRQAIPCPCPAAKVVIFREAVLSCHVSHLGSYKVAWVRVDTQTILTIHNSIITRWSILFIC